MPAATFVDYYALLEVDPQADACEIKAAYRARMVRDHVDQNPEDAAANERMIHLTEAKRVLLDDRRRRAYDLDRARWLTGVPPRPHARRRWADVPPPPPDGYHRVEVDLRDVSIGKLIVGAGVAAMLGGLAMAAKAVADRHGKKRRRRRW